MMICEQKMKKQLGSKTLFLMVKNQFFGAKWNMA
jgi:hypothetical protein